MNYYEHHLGDYLRDTISLTMLEEGAYRRLLDVYYSQEVPLPANFAECCRLARAYTKAERDAVKVVLQRFFTATEDGYRQKRADEEIARYRAKSAKAAASAKARWSAQRPQCDGNANASAEAMRTHSVGNALQSPDSSNQKETSLRSVSSARARGTRIPDDFQPDLDYARQQIPDINAEAEAEKFRDYWRAKPGQGGVKRDWPATWRNWIRTCAESGRYARRGRPAAPGPGKLGMASPAKPFTLPAEYDERIDRFLESTAGASQP